MWRDFYVGDGERNRPITVRIAALEDKLEATDQKLDKISGGLTKLYWTLLIALLGIAANLFIHH